MALATPNEQAHRLQSNLLKITSIGPRSTLAGPSMANFEKRPAHFFGHLPQGIQDAARQKQRAAVLGCLHGQRFGRHTPGEIASIACRSYWALSQILGETPFLTGDLPCGADASVFAQIASALSDFFESHARDAFASYSNLVQYHKE